MKISLNAAGKKYYLDWIFRNASMTFLPGQKSVLLGPNGSGKSTFLQVIAGAVMPSEGVINFENEGKSVSPESTFKFISFAAPYLELLEEFTLREIIHFHFKFKSPQNGISENDIIDLTGLPGKSEQTFKFFSSGMKQRVKLSLALFSDTPILLLDEPCSNLDSKGVEWYKENIKNFTKNRTVIIASNQNKEEYFFCETEVKIDDYKP